MEQQASNRSLRVFITICIGQFVSILGTGLTNFAVGIWVYQKSGSVTKFSLTLLAITVPSILISPFAGALVDRWDRRSTMIVGDLVAGLASLVIAVLLYWGRLQVWQVCAIVAVKAVAGMFHRLAYTASVTLLVPKEQFSRAIGLMQIGPAAAKVVSPLLAGLLLAWITIHQVLMIDFASFLVGVSVLLGVQIPRPATSGESESAKGTLLSEASFGWAYVKTRAGLVWLLLLSAVTSFGLAMSDVVLVPMLIGMTSIGVVGQIVSVAGLGMLGGSIAISAWGGPRHRVNGVLWFTTLFGACLILMGLYPSVPIIAIASFGFIFAVPLIEGCNQAIWLSKTPPNLLGRVSSVRNMIGMSAALFGCLVAGPLADKVFEPLLAADGPLATSVGRVMGVGTGRGLGLFLVTLGVFTLLSVWVGYLNPRLRHVEDELPDAAPEDAAAEGRADEVIAARTATARYGMS
jgi:MFS transporter, DHA3 family, macrolide efflux protein